MVFGSCSSPSKYSLKDYLTISMVIFPLAKVTFFFLTTKGMVFLAVFVINGVSILAISIDNRVWFFVVLS